jgi:UV DNA damage repair endonuclease
MDKKLNLGYACINMTLSDVKPIKNKVTTNRTCIKKTFLLKGLHASYQVLPKIIFLVNKNDFFNYKLQVY